MTPNRYQDLAAVIASWRARVAECREWNDDSEPDDSAFADGLETCADELDQLALLLAEAHPQDQEKKEDTDTRVDTMGNSTDNPTASEHDTTPASVTPTHVSHEARYRQWLVDEADSARAPERWEAYDDALRAFDAMVLAAPAMPLPAAPLARAPQAHMPDCASWRGVSAHPESEPLPCDCPLAGTGAPQEEP